MRMRLRDGLFYADVGMRGIFLDTDSGRYFALNTDANEEFRTALERGGEVAEAASIARFIGRGLLVADSGPDISGGGKIGPCRENLCGSGHISPLVVCLALAANIAAARARRHGSIRHFRDWFLKTPVKGQAKDAVATLSNVNSAFAIVDGIVAQQDRCLVRSVAFARTCRNLGVRVQVVFGVHGEPFGAHCWAQYEDRVLSDTLESVDRFKPIMTWG